MSPSPPTHSKTMIAVRYGLPLAIVLGGMVALIFNRSITGLEGSEGLLDYSATKGAILAFTRSLSQALIEKGVRVNGVAPGPIWTPLIPSTFPAEKVAEFGASQPMKRAGHHRLSESELSCWKHQATAITGELGNIVADNGK